MQDKYVGDIGDFGKFSLIRALAYDRDVGIGWYKTDGSHERNSDGKHIGYLDSLGKYKYRNLDSELFDQLKNIVETKSRSIQTLEECDFLRSAYFHNTVVPSKISRREWREEMCQKLGKCNFIFLDPDNGLERSRLTAKHVAIDDLRALRRNDRAILIYQHQLRVSASNLADWLYESVRLVGSSKLIVIRLRPYSSRLYALIDYDDDIASRAHEFVRKWHPQAELLLEKY